MPSPGNSSRHGHDVTVLTQQPRWRYRPNDAALPYAVERHLHFSPRAISWTITASS